jgi:hypothetical protein
MAVVEALTDEEKYLVAILQDMSGVDLAEFLWKDPNSPDNLFRCWAYQYGWYRNDSKKQIDQCARAIGKSVGIQMRAYAFPFTNPGQEMLITAPELIHLDPVTKNIEDRLLSTRISQEMLQKRNGKTGFVHRPFVAEFLNGSKIIGRIPQKDGKGVKGMHPRWLEMDEAQDYPPPGWIELVETLRYGDATSRWRAHGVSRGVHDHYYKLTQQTDWYVHRITAMHRPDWTSEERKSKAELYGSREHPDYRRNILGAHGDALNPLFVLHRLMACVDTNENSDYNADEYTEIRLNDEYVNDMHMPVTALIDLPGRHKNYQKFWIGMDVGMTNHPTEILVFAEDYRKGGGTPTTDSPQPNVRLKLITRLHLERISGPNQVRVLELLADFYRPQCVAMDRTGLGLPVYQQCVEGLDGNPHPILSRVIRGYNFSEKIPVGFEQPTEEDEWGMYYPEDPLEHAIMANVLEYSSDQLRLLVDKQQLRLPYDKDMLKEFSGQQYFVNRSVTNPYGKKEFNKGKFHTLDAARMAILGYTQHNIEDLLKNQKNIHPDATMVIGLDYNDWGDSESMFF